jgi:hypothetical protein
LKWSATVISTAVDLKGLRVMLSAALPDELSGTSRAQDFYDLIVALSTGVLSSGGRLVFGGHPSVTPLVHRAAQSVECEPGQVQLFQAETYRNSAPEQVFDRRVFGELRWSKDLDSMRDQMAASADAAVFAGGRPAKAPGIQAGIRAELERFLHYHPQGPAYVVGALSGEAKQLLAELSQRPKWGPRFLSDAEWQVLATSDSVDLCVSLILADLARIVEERHPRAS